jgi:hypothetical protein
MPTLDTLGNATWDSVIIRFVTGESVEIRAGGRSIGSKSYKELGFADKKTGKPDPLWGFLKYLASVNGDLSNDELDEKAGAPFKKNISKLRARLKAGFGIADDPFHPCYKSGSFRTRFIISGKP